ncbi:MAG: GNAT family N-acetyltransferase [Filimonas sp.]|nr:GNAT family N-acetyltransferase [Filimonas sp.]
MEINICYATADDAELIADISRQTFVEAFADQNTPENMQKFLNEQFTKEAIIEEVGTDGNTFLMAYAENELVGYVRLRDNKPEELGDESAIEIARIYATATAIGKGIGSELMQACVDTARQLRKDIVWLSVWEQNNKAIEFYKKWGFEKFGEQAFVLGDEVQTDWQMKRNVRM